MKTRRAEIAAALVAAGDAGVSGERLAAALGVSRVAVAKHVSALRELGYGIDAVRGEGYRLTSLPPTLVPVEVERLVTDPFWVCVEGAAETGSTNDDCKVLARAGAEEGTAVVAARQTAGKGRMGRTWISPVGGVYLSALLRPPCAPVDVASLAPACALGVAYGLESLGVPCALKWPNDVLADGKKIAGILLEMSAETDRVEWVVAGCGVNVERSAECFPEGAFVRDHAEASAAAVAAAVLDGLARAYREYVSAGFAAMVAEYEARHSLRGMDVTVRDMAGSVVAAGVVDGIDGFGRLVVRGSEGATQVVAGEVTLRSQGG